MNDKTCLEDIMHSNIDYFFSYRYVIYGPGFSDVFSSPEPKAQVSYLIKICPLSVVVVVVVIVINFSHFRLLLQNHWANFKQLGTKRPFLKGR